MFQTFSTLVIAFFIGAIAIVHTQACIAQDPVEELSIDQLDNSNIRVATYNVSLYGSKAGEVAQRMADGKDKQAEKLAAVIQTVRPDILLLNEVDYDQAGTVANAFAEKFLAVPQGDRQPLDYPYVYSVPTNTGLRSGLDLDGNGKLTDPVDAWGFGMYEGQYALAVLSRYPIVTDEVRTFQKFLWRDFPNAKRPVHPTTGEPYFPDDIWEQLRLSSKNHVDVPIEVGDERIHLLASHPTPPVFDGPEDHNGCRNHDEIKFWEHYLSATDADWIVDDQGKSGGLEKDAYFVIAGDLNSDPIEGDSQKDAMQKLLAHSLVQDCKPRWLGQKDPAKTQTALFGRDRMMRIDYVIPSSQFRVVESGVFWPKQFSPDNRLVDATDHRLVWVEVAIP
ncbi:Endonuclease/Exonuclease/phosphatase family protein [Rubripirellula amarantea]|uniref:Endonuclease/Exonuclease/phosphatase family protein n=1 Tax=Rubripirellula amarantea TaxID=2527999 RepID=A0A5C5WV89_9BACT|nr:endonuclease/exonuclease/phosphatase family protein [Rubripirellula amarantea]TWT54169.1 Endonuclease/Exonuclease/phosphatase family protein [Rubripirellula amarantea]